MTFREKFSVDERYSYWKRVAWTPCGPRACFVLLNPSDCSPRHGLGATVSLCVRLAREAKCSELEIVNLFTLRSANFETLRMAGEWTAIGSRADFFITRAASRASLVVTAWGNHGAAWDRGWAVLRLLKQRVYPGSLHHLGCNRTGHPRHPLHGTRSPVIQPWRE